MNTVVFPIALSLAVAALSLSLRWIVSSPHRVVGSVCFILFASLFLQTGIRASIGSINIEAGDLLSLALFLSTGHRLLKGSYLRPPRWWVWAFAVYSLLYFTSILKGISAGNSLQTIANMQRTHTLVLALLSYFSFVAPGRLCKQRTMNYLIVGAVACAVVALGRFAGVIPLANELMSYGDVVPRPIGSSATMFMASVAFLVWFLWISGAASVWQRWIAVACVVLVVLMQHRSVWLASIAMIASTLVLEKRGRGPALTGVVTAVAGLALLFTLGSTTPVARALASSSERALEQKDTVAWRYQSWDAILSPNFMGSDVNYAVGRPSGTSFARRVAGQLVEVEAHNYYVTMIAVIGVAGLVANLVLLFGLIRLGAGISGPGRAWSVLAIGQAVYWVSYGQAVELALLLGVGFAVWRQGEPEFIFSRVSAQSGKVIGDRVTDKQRVIK